MSSRAPSLSPSKRAAPCSDSGSLPRTKATFRWPRRFDALVAPKRRGGATRALLFAAIAALGVVLFFVLRVRPVAEGAHPPRAILHADSAASWSTRSGESGEEIHVEHGTLWIHVVDHASEGGRLRVMLPDGELEDTGTTFTVSVEDSHTTRVTVYDGSVALRLRGESWVAIGPGETWTPRVPPASCDRPIATRPRPRPRLPPRLARRGRSPPRSRRTHQSSFGQRMAALNGGDNARAAAAFATFLAKHPRDPRAEDAAYLRVLALQRGGDVGAMKRAADEYVRRYPTGFRRTEVEKLSP